MTTTISTVSQLRLLARKHVHTAVATIFGIMTSERVAPNVRLAAATALIDRGFGRVPLMTAVEAGEQGRMITEIVTTIVDPQSNDGAPMLMDEAFAVPELDAPAETPVQKPVDANREDDDVGQ